MIIEFPLQFYVKQKLKVFDRFQIFCYSFIMGETKKMTSSEVHNELDLITLRLLNLSQELIHAKLRLEEMTKQAYDYYLMI
jgi:hypothetical protein